MVQKLSGSKIEVADSLEAVYDLVTERRWGDGLPVIPPTEERVMKMFEGLDKDPDDVIGIMPPANNDVTVEKVAINAVMAGCLPEYMPILIAAIEAMVEPDFNLHAVQATTSPVAPLLIINGPIRKKVNLNCGRGCFGPGWRANATIGRAIRLILINIGGALIGDISKSTFGSPARYSFCIGEDEENSPWDPLHVERGYEKGVSTVTAVAVNSFINSMTQVRPGFSESNTYLMLAATSLALPGSVTVQDVRGPQVVVFTSGQANVLNKAGFAKKGCKEFLWNHARFPEEKLYGAHACMKDPKVVNGMVLCCPEPNDILIVVAGAPETYHVLALPGWSNMGAITKVIREKK
ncbi:hypothetical protein FJZ33_00670 [Candidatus Poribacteria bacterium]|nr:hypothetical protein [Candidatus Poribacteria bacterium]